MEQAGVSVFGSGSAPGEKSLSLAAVVILGSGRLWLA
jgi:hypothetical protein